MSSSLYEITFSTFHVDSLKRKKVKGKKAAYKNQLLLFTDLFSNLRLKLDETWKTAEVPDETLREQKKLKQPAVDVKVTPGFCPSELPKP